MVQVCLRPLKRANQTVSGRGPTSLWTRVDSCRTMGVRYHGESVNPLPRRARDNQCFGCPQAGFPHRGPDHQDRSLRPCRSSGAELGTTMKAMPSLPSRCHRPHNPRKSKQPQPFSKLEAQGCGLTQGPFQRSTPCPRSTCGGSVTRTHQLREQRSGMRSATWP